MKIIIGIVIALAGFLKFADEVGNFCEDVNPCAPEDYPEKDMGEDFTE